MRNLYATPTEVLLVNSGSLMGLRKGWRDKKTHGGTRYFDVISRRVDAAEYTAYRFTGSRTNVTCIRQATNGGGASGESVKGRALLWSGAWRKCEEIVLFLPRKCHAVRTIHERRRDFWRKCKMRQSEGSRYSSACCPRPHTFATIASGIFFSLFAPSVSSALRQTTLAAAEILRTKSEPKIRGTESTEGADLLCRIHVPFSHSFNYTSEFTWRCTQHRFFFITCTVVGFQLHGHGFLQECE